MLEQKCCPLHIFQVRIHTNLAPFIYHWSFIVLYCIQRNIVDWFIVHTYSTRSHWGFLILIQSTNCINFYILKGMRTALISAHLSAFVAFVWVLYSIIFFLTSLFNLIPKRTSTAARNEKKIEIQKPICENLGEV